jgi:hypothetical protein
MKKFDYLTKEEVKTLLFSTISEDRLGSKYECIDGRWYEKYGTYQEVPIKTLADTTWFLHQMMLAGYEYAQLKGIEAKKPPTYKNLLAVTDIADLPKINAAIVNTLNRGLKRNVELEQPKNGEATLPENEEQRGM